MLEVLPPAIKTNNYVSRKLTENLSDRLFTFFKKNVFRGLKSFL